MSDAEGTPDDRARGRQIGIEQYRPDLYPGGSLRRAGLADFHAAGYMMLRAGIQVATLRPPVVDLDELLDGVLAGMHEAHAEHRASTASHANQPGCDPDAPWGMCEYCEAYADSMKRSRDDKARWSRESEDPDREFVVGGSGSKVHTRTCPAVTRMISSAEAEIERLSPADAKHGGFSARWPYLLTREAAVAQRRHRCGVCCPDLPDKRSSGAVKGSDGRFVAVEK